MAGYLINRTPPFLLHGQTPYELLNWKVSSYSHIRNFSCLAYVYDLELPKDKFCVRSRVCVFLGYPFNKKGWRFMIWKIKNLFCPEMWSSMKPSFHIWLWDLILQNPHWILQNSTILGKIFWDLRKSLTPLHRTGGVIFHMGPVMWTVHHLLHRLVLALHQLA